MSDAGMSMGQYEESRGDAPPAPVAIEAVDPLTFTDDMPEFPPAVLEALREKVDPALVQIREPGDLLYVPWIHYQRVLVNAFGLGGFRMVPRAVPRTEGNKVTWLGALFVRIPGTSKFHFIKEAKGECNASLGAGNAAEGAESDCLTKCCKRLNIFAELFDPDWRRAWEKQYRPTHDKAKQTRAWPAARSGGASPAAGAAASPASATPAPTPHADAATAPAEPPADTGEAATPEQLDAIRTRIKFPPLSWKVDYMKIWFKARFGITTPSTGKEGAERLLSALTAQQADTAYLLLNAFGTNVYETLLAQQQERGACR